MVQAERILRYVREKALISLIVGRNINAKVLLVKSQVEMRNLIFEMSLES